MPKYFLHLIDGTDILLDPHGMDMPTEAVAGAALLNARDCMAGDVRDGRLDLNYRVEVHNDAGELVHSLPFTEAVKITSVHA